MNRTLAIAFAAAALTGCAIPPQNYMVNRVATVPVPKEVVWDRLVRFFALNSIQVKTIDKASGVIFAERQLAAAATGVDRGLIGNYADCGAGFLDIPFMNMIQLNVYVREVGAGSEATVTTTFRQVFKPGSPNQSTECNSTGILESEILAALRAG